MHAIKTVGKSGQISLGKALAGTDFVMEELPIESASMYLNQAA